MNKVIICKDHIQEAIEFGRTFASPEYEKSSKDFGSRHVKERRSTDKIADTISGKLGEFAFKEFCKQNGFEIEIDMSLKKGYREIDNGQDIVSVNGVAPKLKFDIKESKSYAQWLLVESHKISEEIIMADIYIFVRLKLPRNIEYDLSLFNVEAIEAEISGFAYREDFFDIDKEPWFNYAGGSKLIKGRIATNLFLAEGLTSGNYRKNHIINEFRKIISSGVDVHMGVSLKAELNYGLPIGILRNRKKDYDELFFILLNNHAEPEHIIERYRRVNKYS